MPYFSESSLTLLPSCLSRCTASQSTLLPFPCIASPSFDFAIAPAPSTPAARFRSRRQFSRCRSQSSSSSHRQTPEPSRPAALHRSHNPCTAGTLRLRLLLPLLALLFAGAARGTVARFPA